MIFSPAAPLTGRHVDATASPGERD